jgi:hypothetical protein
MTLTVLLDPDESISELYGVWAYPTTVWIDEDGTMANTHAGHLTNEQVDSYMAEMMGQ